MADRYIVVTCDRSIYYFDQEQFYKFVNEEDVEEEEDKNHYTFLSSFPLPNFNGNSMNEDPMGNDDEGRPMGDYCPFSEGQWPQDALFVVKNKEAGFVPKVKKVEKTSLIDVYCEPEPKAPRTRTRTPAQKQARRRR